MTRVVKVDPEWTPIENPFLKVGDEISIDNVETLLAEGKVKLPEKKKETVVKTKKK